jgi:nucleotide-binding universal stress UspA family protein
MSYRNILVPLDGSHFAEAALAYAVRLAKSARARLHLVMVHEPVPALVGMGETPPLVDLDEQSRLQEKSYLATVSGELVQSGYSAVEFRELDGAPGPSLCEEAARLEADLVVMATHGRGAIGRLWLGSVADYLIRHLSIPVLLIHPDRHEPPKEPALHSIIVALDLSPEGEAVLDPVVALAQLTGGHLTLVHVIEPVMGAMGMGIPYPPTIPPQVFEEQRSTAQRKLDQIADRLRERGPSVCARLVDSASAAMGLLELLNQDRYDVLAMTTHGRGGVQRLLLGSVADKVIRGASKPVLVVRPPDKKAPPPPA